MKTVLRDKDLVELKDVILEAERVWKDASREEFQKIGDVGSCIIGDGVAISYLGPRKRKPVTKIIISSNAVACAQGSAHYEKHKDKALQVLKDNGVDCFYSWGRMD